MKEPLALAFVSTIALSFALVSCSATAPSSQSSGGSSASGGAGGGGAGSTGTGGDFNPAGSGGGPPDVAEDPKTCAEAASARSYIGCDFWPTVLDNIVNPVFDYAVVVANAGDSPADVSVSRNGMSIASATVDPSSLSTLFLPWVPELKDTNAVLGCSTSVKLSTARANGGAYHLTSNRPVTVYQFNALEYAPTGGPAGKDWSACNCPIAPCFSYTNDASLLLPSTAQTKAYRVMGPPRWKDPDNNDFETPPYFAVTGLSDNTSVTVKLAPGASIAGGGGIANTPAGGTAQFAVNQGDVVEVIGGPNTDFSGTLVLSSQPIQVLSGISCTNMPQATDACDHIEESVFPAETLGKRYFVTVPTSPAGAIGHVVRIYGNVDGTKLDYPGMNPGGPATIDAGQTVDLGVVSQSFEIKGDHEFGVSSFQVGASMLFPGVPSNQQKGDPAMSLMTAVEQYRTKYVFLAPNDYDMSYVDVIGQISTKITVDGTPMVALPKPLSSNYGVWRVPLGPGKNGAHVLTSTEPVGLQVMGYGTYTSYQYPGGLNLSTIAPPPPK